MKVVKIILGLLLLFIGLIEHPGTVYVIARIFCIVVGGFLLYSGLKKTPAGSE